MNHHRTSQLPGLDLTGTAPARSKLGSAAQSAVRIALAVAAIVALAVIAALAYGWPKLQRAGEPGPVAQAIVLRQATMQLLADGFVGCPTVQQVLELSTGPSKSQLQNEMGNDPWGTPFQIQCERERVRVFSMGPDKLPGTPDDIGSDPRGSPGHGAHRAGLAYRTRRPFIAREYPPPSSDTATPTTMPPARHARAADRSAGGLRTRCNARASP